MTLRRGSSLRGRFLACLLIGAVAAAGRALAGADEAPPAPGPDAPPAFDPVFASHRAVAHALGGIEGVAYSNSAQAFARSLELGFRLFEVDLAFAGSGTLVCFHKGDWDQLVYPETEGSGSSGRPLFAGRFDMMTFRELLARIRDRRDVFLILDTKEDYERVLRGVIEIARSVDPALLGQIIPQLYRPRDLALVRSLYAFDRLVFTLFSVPELSEEAIRDFVRQHRLPAVAMPEQRVDAAFIRSLRREGALVYVHTINDPDRVKWALEKGAHGIYTDFDTSLLAE